MVQYKQNHRDIKLSNQVPLCSEPKKLTLKLIVSNIWF